MDSYHDSPLSVFSAPDKDETPRKVAHTLGMQQPDSKKDPKPDGGSFNWQEFPTQTEGPHSQYLSTEQIEEYQRQQSARDRGDSFGSASNSTSSGVPDYSSEDEDNGKTMASQGGVGLGVVAEGTAFPKRPTIIIPSNDRGQSTATLERYLSIPDAEALEGTGLIGYVCISYQKS